MQQLGDIQVSQEVVVWVAATALNQSNWLFLFSNWFKINYFLSTLDFEVKRVQSFGAGLKFWLWYVLLNSYWGYKSLEKMFMESFNC